MPEKGKYTVVIEREGGPAHVVTEKIKFEGGGLWLFDTKWLWFPIHRIVEIWEGV